MGDAADVYKSERARLTKDTVQTQETMQRIEAARKGESGDATRKGIQTSIEAVKQWRRRPDQAAMARKGASVDFYN